MRQFNSIEEYNSYLVEQFGKELGLSEQAFQDFEDFVAGNDYVILDVLETEECSALKIGDTYYWMVERVEGMRFSIIENPCF